MLEQLALFRLPLPSPVPTAGKPRCLLIGPRVVDYRLRTGTRRLSMAIDDRGLRIAAPRGLSIDEIEGFVRSHGAWVLNKLDELASQSKPRHLRIVDGTRIPLLGREALVRTQPGANRVRWIGDTVLLEARPDAELSVLAQRALQKRALAHFSELLSGHCTSLGLRPPPLGLSSARTRWGSCSRQSGIRINWRLIHLPEAFGNYVIAHEAAHLVEMNHSRRFWSVVDSLCPDWQTVRDELKARAATIPIL